MHTSKIFDTGHYTEENQTWLIIVPINLKLDMKHTCTYKNKFVHPKKENCEEVTHGCPAMLWQYKC